MSPLDATSTPTSAPIYASVAGTIVVHGALVLLASLLGTRTAADGHETISATQLFDVALPAAAPPPPRPPAEQPPTQEPAPVRPTPVTLTRAPASKAQPVEPPAEQPPAAARAGQVLAANTDTADVRDSLVIGNGNTYTGGATDGQGTSNTVVSADEARGASATEAPRVAVRAVDLSRPPRLAGGASWECPFPIEADDAGVDHAVVTLRVEVGADGRPGRVDILKDPGSGFAREARRCATSKRWQAGLDRLGHAAASQATVNVRFDR